MRAAAVTCRACGVAVLVSALVPGTPALVVVCGVVMFLCSWVIEGL